MMRVGRIPYVNCYPVYGAIDRGIVTMNADIVDGVPTELNAMMAGGALDVSVISAVEYARSRATGPFAVSCFSPSGQRQNSAGAAYW
jgi:predicted solute-binding protein